MTREEAIKVIRKMLACTDLSVRANLKADMVDACHMAIKALEQEPRKGHWIADVDRWGDLVTTVNGYRCDKCNTFNADKDNYCPNCGADMREVVEE